MTKVEKRLAKKGIKIQVSQDVKSFLVEKGFDQNLGARPLKRVIQKFILDPLSLSIVIGEIGQGEKVVLELKDSKIIFNTIKGLTKINQGVKA